jgi:hypothetical protein
LSISAGGIVLDLFNVVDRVLDFSLLRGESVVVLIIWKYVVLSFYVSIYSLNETLHLH